MAKKIPKNPKDLPQHPETWCFAVRKLRTWIVPEGEDPVRPYLSITFNLNEKIIQDVQLGELPTSLEAQETLFSAMRKPQKELKTQPHRPSRIDFEDRELMEALTPALQEIGVATRYRSNELVNQLVKDLEEHLGGDKPEIPGLLTQRKVTTKIVANLFNSAAEFYRAAPWVQLQNDDVLSIQLSSQKIPYYAIVMGQGGIEYGLALYKRWEDVEQQFLHHNDPEESIPPDGLNSFFFNPVHEVPINDLEAIERYGWEVASKDAYPVPFTFIPPDEVHRPDRDVLLWYEATLRAIPIFVQNHISRDAEGEIEPVEAEIHVNISTGPVIVRIKYPAGELPLARLPEYSFDEMDEDEMSFPLDRRVMEGDMYRMFGMFSEQDIDPKLEKAQQIMYDAWEERNPVKRIALARKALKTSRDCTDAYVLLAEEEADTVQRAYEYYQQGIQAGERALGEDYFDENVGHFWGLLETRPYMRSLEGAATCLWKMGRKEEALRIYNQMLHLNPGDNQGIRYVLVDLLLSLNRERELEKILKSYENDWSSVLFYTKALLSFRKGGPTEKAKRNLLEAIEQNRHVLDYLTGKKRIPANLPDYIQLGEDTEAADYATNHINYWRQTPGAVDWLKEISSSSPSVRSTGKANASKKKENRKR